MRVNPFHPQEMISPAHRGASRNFIQLGYLQFVLLAIALFAGGGVRAASIRKVTGSTLDQAESSALDSNFRNINNELLNCLHKTSTETIHGYKYFTDPVIFVGVSVSTITASSATLTAATITTLTGTTITETTGSFTQVNTTSITINGLLYGGNPVGTVVMYVNATAPSGWLVCNGASVSTTTYARLFSAVGYTFGGAGANFSLPDFRGVFPKGSGTTDRAAGKDASGNFYAATLGSYSTDQMQGHYHNLLHYGTEQTTIPTTNTGVSGNSNVMHGSGAVDNQQIEVRAPRSDGTNGTPRTAHTTEPQNLGINFIIYAGI